MHIQGITMRKTLMIGLLCFMTNSVQAAVFDMRDYFESLPSPYPAQSSSDLWTFQVGNHNGSLIAPLGDSYYAGGSLLPQQIGMLVNTGQLGCTPGFCPSSPSTTVATFDGVFVHPGPSTNMAAVFHASSAMQISKIELQSEMVQNGNNGNGFNVTVNSVLGGVTNTIGTFVFDYSSTLNSFMNTIYTPASLTLQAGDMIEILYGNNGSYLYDHGNVNAQITTGPAVSPVPEPEIYAMMGLGLGLLGWVGRRKQRAA